MKRLIVIEIDAEQETCGECRLWALMTMPGDQMQFMCEAFRAPISGVATLDWDAGFDTDVELTRCPQCLAAELPESEER